MLTARQIDLVQQSFAAVLPLSDATGAAFYERLFAMEPETRQLFGTDLTAQGRKLFMTLTTMVDALDRLDRIVPVARELAIRHIRYGARERHYAAVGNALIETMRGTLGPAFDAETEAAWRAGYAVLAETMLLTHRAAAAA